MTGSFLLRIAGAFVNTASLRLVHISDTHFQTTYRHEYQGPYLPHLHPHSMLAANALATRIKHLQLEHGSDPFHILVTGDLTLWGRPVQLDSATTFLRGVHYVDRAESNSKGLRGRDDLMALPGNHDAWDGLPVRPRKPFFDSYFPQRYPAEIVESVGGRTVAVLGLDSTFPRRKNFAQGYIEPLEISACEAAIANLRMQPDTLIIVAFHHSPVMLSRTGTITTTRLLNYRAMLTFLKNTKIDLLLCGHEHHPDLFILNNPPYRTYVSIGGTATAHPRLSLCTFRVYDVFADRIELTTYYYRSNTAGFECDDPMQNTILAI
jgi:3',5'-cyclic AMP phosphodiesterase CpdA